VSAIPGQTFACHFVNDAAADRAGCGGAPMGGPCRKRVLRSFSAYPARRPRLLGSSTPRYAARGPFAGGHFVVPFAPGQPSTPRIALGQSKNIDIGRMYRCRVAWRRPRVMVTVVKEAMNLP
jgi:hypothetical protein